MNLDDFRAAWTRLVVRWDQLERRSTKQATLLLRDARLRGLEAVAAGLPGAPEALAGDALADAERRCTIALLRATDAVDVEGYRTADVLPDGADPVEHFATTGWRFLRSPAADFDLWWYWCEHLDPASTAINPLVHYLLDGEHRGLPTTPAPAPDRGPAPLADGATRRICLFAGYDADGIADDYVIAYLTELSRHADVYYLADGTMPEDELAKVARVTKGAWAVRHGRYDFGSFALLASEYVGWDIIDSYDELLLANDSCYLLRPLDEVFARMADVSADWWGLHATKRDFAADHGQHRPIPLAEATHTAAEAWQPHFRLHASSFFLLFRKRVLEDEGFRRRLSTVARQEHKAQVILKYEIGLSDYLLKAGFRLDTFIADLYPYLPTYTADYFEILEQGFPLLKRNFISENPRRCPDLHRWQERVLAVVPEAPVELFEQNLRRVAADDKLTASLAIRTRPDGTVDQHLPLGREDFEALDQREPKRDDWWAFPVCAFDHTFAGNERAVFDEVRDDPAITKIVLTRSRRVEVAGENVVVVPLMSPEGQHYLARSRQVFVKHGPLINVPWPLVDHHVINLWHGIPLKRFGHAMVDQSTDWGRLATYHRGCDAVISSSAVDSLAMAAAFYPLTVGDMWPTGLPRNDYITCAEDRLPDDMRRSLDELRQEVGDRRLVMLLPTFKDGQADAYYDFSATEIERLRGWLERSGAVLGVREHMADTAHSYSASLAPLSPIDLSARRFPNLEVLYRAASALISDYSSCLVDFLLTGRPVVSFAYDYERYVGHERGLFYELDEVLPGPVCRTFDELADALDRVFDEPTAAQREQYELRRALFFDHLDDGASARVVARVKELYRA